MNVKGFIHLSNYGDCTALPHNTRERIKRLMLWYLDIIAKKHGISDDIFPYNPKTLALKKMLYNPSNKMDKNVIKKAQENYRALIERLHQKVD